MAGRDVDETRAGVVVHEVSPAKNLPVRLQNGCWYSSWLEVPAVEAADDLVILPAAFLGHRRQQQGGNDELLLAHLHERVAESGVVSHGKIRRQRPRRRGPDDDGRAGLADQRETSRTRSG